MATTTRPGTGHPGNVLRAPRGADPGMSPDLTHPGSPHTPPEAIPASGSPSQPSPGDNGVFCPRVQHWPGDPTSLQCPQGHPAILPGPGTPWDGEKEKEQRGKTGGAELCLGWQVWDMGDTTLGLSPGCPLVQGQPTHPSSSRRNPKLLRGTFHCNLLLIIP